MNVDTIPAGLRDRAQWVAWKFDERDGKRTKVPYRADGRGRASTTGRASWGTFEAAVAAMEAIPADGVGYVFSADDNFAGVDLDAGLSEAERRAIVADLDSYTERSVSGAGLHVIVRASLNGHGRNRCGPFEVYERGRFFVMTGDHVPGTPATIEERQAQLEDVLARFLPVRVPVERPARDPQPVDLDDQELLERAMRARNGSDFAALWSGDTTGYASQSEADAALCAHLAWWTDRDHGRIDSLMRSSGLFHPKWDDRRGDSTYGSQTIASAIALTGVGYRPGDKTAGPTTGEPVETRSAEEPMRDHTWRPKNLLDAATGDAVRPTILALLYLTMRHVISGETESLKTWLALIAAVEQIQAGRDVGWIDFEMGARQTLERLRALGLTDQQIKERFIYLEPSEPIGAPGVLGDLLQLLDERRPTLVVIDAYEGASALHELDPDKSKDVEKFYKAIVGPLRSSGAAVVLIDHLPKSKETRGKYAIGSQRKIGAADVHLGVEVLQPFGRGRIGRAQIMTHKDRGAYLPRPKAAELELRSDLDTGRVTWTLTVAEPASLGSEPEFRPTCLMERVSRHIENAAEPIAAQNDLERDVTGNGPAIRQAAKLLVREGYITPAPYAPIRPYREEDDPGPASPAKSPSASTASTRVPSASQARPDTTSPSASTASPALLKAGRGTRTQPDGPNLDHLDELQKEMGL